MRLFRSLDKNIPQLPLPIGLTIGNFDGVHLGHQALLKYLTNLPVKTKALLTFANHPLQVLQPHLPIIQLTPLPIKLRLLSKYIDCALIPIFTKTIAEQSYITFLQNLHSHLPFSHLVLGEGACLGKNREGTPANIAYLGKSLGFQAHFIKKVTYNGEIISSGLIRKYYQKNAIDKIAPLLGRNHLHLPIADSGLCYDDTPP